MRAMQEPDSLTVLAPFAGETFDHFSDRYQFVQEGDRYVVVDGQDSIAVAYTFGHEPLQQYLLPTHGGRLQALTVTWDTDEEKWYSLYADEPTPEGDILHWKSANLNWNYMCADCHSTGLKRGYDLASDTYSTTWEEMTVGCEACHGPGQAHEEWAEKGTGVDPFLQPVREPVVPGQGRSSNLVVEAEIDMCASCHARRVPLDEAPVHGAAFLDRYAPSLLDEGLYYADGQIRDEVYVYGSFVQSKMAQSGVTCSDCHDPHSGKRLLEGSALCQSCHVPASYDTAAHGLHEPDSPAALCESCHMPQTTYMGVDERRDHRFGIPDPIRSAKLGAPDVCQDCHTDRSPEWAASFLERPTQWREESVLEQIARTLADSTQSNITKGSALSRLSAQLDPESIRLAMLGLQADSPHEKVGALRAFAGWGPAVPTPDMKALLRDSVKWVRTEAVATALSLGGMDWSAPANLEALQEYISAQAAVEERPEVHVNLAGVYEQLQQAERADQEWSHALRLDSTSADLWTGYALFSSRKGPAARQEAERGFRRASSLPGPHLSETYYLFGLFLAEDRVRLVDAARLLKESSDLDLEHPRKAYNAGLAYQQIGDAANAEYLLNRALGIGLVEAEDALVILFMQNEEWNRAQSLNDALLVRFPNRTELNERGAYIRSNL